MTFNPKDYVMNMRGKDYLEVKWRIVWFRDAHPRGGIITEIVSTDPLVIKATVADEEGRTLATGFGTPKLQGVAKERPFEGAETAAIGRALAVAGFGTQFTGEDEGEHLADSPVEKPAPAKNGKPQADTKTPAASKNGAKPFNFIEWAVSDGVAENEHAAKNIFAGLNLGSKPITEWKELALDYRAFREGGMKAEFAFEHVNAGNKPGKEA